MLTEPTAGARSERLPGGSPRVFLSGRNGSQYWTRKGAAAICVPPSEFESLWAAGVLVQIQGTDAGPFFAGEGDIDAARALVEEAEDAELLVYPGDRLPAIGTPLEPCG